MTSREGKEAAKLCVGNGALLGVKPARLLAWTGSAQTNKIGPGSRPAKWVIIGPKLGPNKWALSPPRRRSNNNKTR